MNKPQTSTGEQAGITTPQGFRAAGGTCGIKASGKADLMLIVADSSCAAAGVFTTSRTPAAAVTVGQRNLRRGNGRAIICNSGNANASTGRTGLRDAEAMCQLAAQQLGCDAREVVPCSTGIIGVPLPMEKITAGIEVLAGHLSRGTEADAAAAAAIMTTDLVPKVAHQAVQVGGKTVQVAGIAKGSGMIAPNMATMLAFLTTDAAVEPSMLQAALARAVSASFNRISVDQHTSPSDAALILASGAAGNKVITDPGPELAQFTEAMTAVCRSLAYQIVADGEGATKVMRIAVSEARSEQEADRVARTIVDSPLVKTAVHGGDPNWGRIITAAGYSGAAIEPERMVLTIGDVCVYREGQPVSLEAGNAQRLDDAMKGKEVAISLSLGLGSARVEWLGCDLSKQYVTINADYTT